MRVMLLHMPFKATAQSAKPVRQVRTPTPVLAPPAPPVVLVLRVAKVPTRPRSPAPMAPIKSQPPVTPVTGWSEVRVVRVQLIHMPFKATMRRVKPVRQGHTPTPVLAPPAPPVVLVLRVAKVPTRPRSRVLRAPIKLRPPVTLVMVLLWIVATCKEFRDCANHNLFCDVLATDIFTF